MAIEVKHKNISHIKVSCQYVDSDYLLVEPGEVLTKNESTLFFTLVTKCSNSVKVSKYDAIALAKTILDHYDIDHKVDHE